MIRTCLLPAAALLLTAGTAAAQDAGGIGFPAGGISAANMAQAFAQPARLPVFANPQRRGAPPGALVTNPAVSRKSVHQDAITKIRGDAGLLGGFNKGQALAPSRQPPPTFAPPITFIDAPFIVNNVNSALNFAFGDGNVSEQKSVQTSGEAAPTPPGPGTRQPVAPVAPAAPPPVLAGPKPDALMTTMGPLPHLPYALENGGVQFNNVNSSVNMAVGKGNVAAQRVKMIQK
ncbi:hypothetical protein [Azospirillum sp. sgz301742]